MAAARMRAMRQRRRNQLDVDWIAYDRNAARIYLVGGGIMTEDEFADRTERAHVLGHLLTDFLEGK
jgi:hypothetical protein